jgi:hypothetical protein
MKLSDLHKGDQAIIKKVDAEESSIFISILAIINNIK